MSSGLRFVAPQDPDYDPSRGYPDHLYVYTGAIDAFQWAVTRPPQWPPNTVGRYRNSDPLVVSYLIKKAALARGEEYLSYPQRHLFDKLGIRHMVLEPDPYGNFLLQGYDFGTGRDWLRLGLLYLQDGVWNGERLLARGLGGFRAHARAGLVGAGIRRILLAQPDAALAGAGGRLLHGGRRRPVRDHHPDPRSGRRAPGPLQGRRGRRRRPGARAVSAGGSGAASAQTLAASSGAAIAAGGRAQEADISCWVAPSK